MLVSIYLPTRNRCKLLSAAVASVLRQDFQDFELIIVDDASADETPQLLAALAGQDSRVRFIRNDQPQGGAASRNRAIRAATGAFATGLDDDDEFEDHRLSAFLDFWNALPRYGAAASCLFGQDVLISEGAEIGVSCKRGTVCYSDLLEANYIGGQIFAPKSVFEGVGLFNAKLPAWQDLEMFMRVAKQHGPARLVDLPLYRFDVSQSRDRISTKEERVRSAYRMVSDLHCAGDARAQQKLLMQLFSNYYGFRPTVSDLVEYGRLGVNLTGLLSLSTRVLRGSIGGTFRKEHV
jgi:glycosyltransferase involved in cell wall biosynthesis